MKEKRERRRTRQANSLSPGARRPGEDSEYCIYFRSV